jgi:CRISPR-associated protein Csb1
LFADKEYSGLVPQIAITAGTKKVNLLAAGHRAGDAIIRCSALQEEMRKAFEAAQNGNAEPLARIAPTSIVFGVWDSRDTQAKLPRLISSTIRAYDVRKLTRSAQFVPATEYVADGLLEAPADKSAQAAYSERGFTHVPATGSHGGVIADGGIRRDASLHLAALRLIGAGDGTIALQRYILGLALTALTYPASGYLRQGCNLVLDPDKKREFVEVYGDGRREPTKLTHADVLSYARAAAREFVPGPDREVAFDQALAKADVSGEAGGSRKGSRKGRAGKGAKSE